MALTKSTYRMTANSEVNVKDFGAVGDGVTDDTSAIQAALSFVYANQNTASGAAVGMGNRKKIIFPEGVYLVSASIELEPYTYIDGFRAIIKAATDTFDIFTDLQYMTVIRGIQFLGGTRALHIKTGNIDSTVINIEECEFQQQTTASIASDDNSASTLLTVTNCKFYNTITTANIVDIPTIDMMTMTDCWVQSGCEESFIIGSSTEEAVLTAEGLLCVPLGTANQVWFRLNSSKLKIIHSRFGGESGGATLVKNYAQTRNTDPTSIVITDNEIFAANPKNVVQFYRLPNIFVFENNNGLYDTKGFYFDSGAQSDLLSYQGVTNVFKVDANKNETLMQKGDIYCSLRTLLQNPDRPKTASDTIQSSQIVLQIPINSASYTPTTSNTETASASGTDMFGNPTIVVAAAGGASGDDGQFGRSFATALASGFTQDAIYTMSVPVSISGIRPYYFALVANNQQKRFMLSPGEHVLNMPFVYSGSATNPNLVSINIFEYWSAATSQDVAIGTIRFFAREKNVTTKNVIAYGTAAPSSGQYMIGDRVINSSPTVGQPKAWVCTVAGTPGTWVSEGNL
jgi:hypothetical protein